MGYIGGRLQEAFVRRIRELDRDRLLAVPIDVGKHTAMAVVCDFWGKVVVAPFTFSLNDRGFEALTAAVGRARGIGRRPGYGSVWRRPVTTIRPCWPACSSAGTTWPCSVPRRS